VAVCSLPHHGAENLVVVDEVFTGERKQRYSLG